MRSDRAEPSRRGLALAPHLTLPLRQVPHPSVEKAALPELLKSAADAVGLIVSRGFAAAMNQVNQRKPR